MCLLGGGYLLPEYSNMILTILEALIAEDPVAICSQDLVTAILDIMGLSADAVSDNDSLAAMGIDSMQLVEVSLASLSGSRTTLLH